MKKILFLGLGQSFDDARTKYRQVYKIKETDLSIECAYLATSSLSSDSDNMLRVLSAIKKRSRLPRFLSRVQTVYRFLRTAAQYEPDVVQVSHVRELIPAFVIHFASKCQLIYDSREDYFNQMYEYSGRTLSGWIRGAFYWGVEFILARFAHAVFCTDEYLYDLYRKPYFGCRKVYLLRSFVNLDMVEQRAVLPEQSEPLRLVYVGGFNIYRGILECASYVARYNDEKSRLCLTLDLYGPDNSVVEQVSKTEGCEYRGLVSHKEVFQVLPKYHVGVCLLKHIRKYERNLPQKNFEYMSVGLPVITSDFGNLKKYVDQSQSGICIDPTSYEEFKEAVEMLMQPEAWIAYSNNGYTYTRTHLNLDLEIAPYLKTILS